MNKLTSKIDELIELIKEREKEFGDNFKGYDYDDAKGQAQALLLALEDELEFLNDGVRVFYYNNIDNQWDEDIDNFNIRIKELKQNISRLKKVMGA